MPPVWTPTGGLPMENNVNWNWPALTIHQHWADAFFLDSPFRKDVENRT